MNKKSRYVPFTPAGSRLAHLESKTEDGAWKKLLNDASHMPYKTIKQFKARGYMVEEI